MSNYIMTDKKDPKQVQDLGKNTDNSLHIHLLVADSDRTLLKHN